MVTGISVLVGELGFRCNSLQWGPVVVTGISTGRHHRVPAGWGRASMGPVVVTGISERIVQAEDAKQASMGSGRGDRNQVVTGRPPGVRAGGFNGVRSW